MRLWLIGALVVLLIVGAVGYQALTATSVSENSVAQAVFSYDLIIRNVVIVDGTGADRQYGSIGILGDRITAMGPSISGWGRRVIDGKGLYAAPGFIDLGPLTEPHDRKLLMGVTTQVVKSTDPAPLRSAQHRTNVAWVVDQAELDRQVTGGAGKGTEAHLQQLRERLTTALQLGASGTYLTASSSYSSMLGSDTALWSILRDQGRRLFWQMPVDEPGAIDRVAALLALSMEQHTPVHVSAMNLSRPSDWGRVYDLINLIDRGGAGFTADVVPYMERPQVAERDLVVLVSHPSIAIASGSDAQHPAATGAYPRLLQRFVNQEPILSIEEAITKSTSLPATILGLKDRGVLRVGAFADIVLFDGSTINAPVNSDQAPSSIQGVHAVLVNGKIAVDAGSETGVNAGRLLSAETQPKQ